MNANFLNSILFIISIILNTVGIVALTNGKKKQSNIYLGAFFLMLGIVVFFRFLELSQLMLKVPYLMDLDFSLVFLMLPSYYFFVKTYLFEYKPTLKEHLLHSLLAIFVFTFLCPVYFFNSADKIHYILTESTSSTSWRYQILNPLYFFQSVCYLLYILRVTLKKTNSKLKNSIENLRWIRVLTSVMLLLQLSPILMLLFVEGKQKYNFLPLAGLFILLVLIIWMTKRFELISQRDDSMTDEPKTKYQNSKLSDSEIVVYAEQISLQLSENQLFLNQNLSLEILSDELNLSIRILSEVINRHFSCTFYELVNMYRVEYCKTLLLQNNNLITIEAIGQNAGFNSRATFYSNFKKQTGLTPSNYSKNQKILID